MVPTTWRRAFKMKSFSGTMIAKTESLLKLAEMKTWEMARDCEKMFSRY